MKKIQAKRYHDICCGHRVVGHEGKCRHLHGHNYRFHFVVEANKLDKIGRVMDFSVIKEKLAMWLEDNWDHRMLIWNEDPFKHDLQMIDRSVVLVPFNPTAENIAEHFTDVIAPFQLIGTECKLVELTIEETRKCSVTYKID